MKHQNFVNSLPLLRTVLRSRHKRQSWRHCRIGQSKDERRHCGSWTGCTTDHSRTDTMVPRWSNDTSGSPLCSPRSEDTAGRWTIFSIGDQINLINIVYFQKLRIHLSMSLENDEIAMYLFRAINEWNEFYYLSSLRRKRFLGPDQYLKISW